MKWLDDLYAELLLIEDFDLERINGFADRNRLVLQRALEVKEPDERLLEIFALVASAREHSARAEEAVPFARAAIDVHGTMDAKQNTGYLRMARSALVRAYFDSGRRSDALRELDTYEMLWPDDPWARNMRDLILTIRARRVSQWLLYGAGGLMVLQWVARWTMDLGNLVVSLVGVGVFLASLLIEQWSKRRERDLRARQNAMTPPLRVV